MRKRSIIAATAAAAALIAPALAVRPASAVADSQGFGARLLQTQNVERRSLGLSPMRWDPQLAAAASAYAAEMAATDSFEHSDDVEGSGQGENLWMGTRGAFTAEEMAGDWIAEKKVFRAGVFPNVSTTGDWSDVGHYTQIIWADTDRIGCGLSSSAEYDYLVCRYAQPGNVMGEMVMPTRFAAAN